jgi:DNA-binding response OmpR family regulator
LLARIRALLRRAHPGFAAAPPRWIRFGDIAICPAARAVQRNGVVVELRPKEFDLLLALYRQHDRVVSRAELLRDVWGYHSSTISRTVDTHMAGLRLKLEADPLTPRHLLTVRTAGYMLRRDAEPR